MRALLVFACACGAALAQEAAKPLTAEQVIEKSIAASGGREAIAKISSTVGKGAVDVTFAGATASLEFYAKAPNKRLIVTELAGFGTFKNGFDGTVSWADDPQGGLREITGAQLEQTRRESVFNAALKWKEMYPKVELKGKEKVGEREAYVLVLTPGAGKPVTQYYDAETFMLARQVSTQVTEQGEMEIIADFSDFREVDGIKTPFQIKQILPMGDVVIKFTEMKNNVAIEDAKFSKPVKAGH